MQYVTAWMDGWRRLFQFDGRASRKGFWSFYLGNGILIVVLALVGNLFDSGVAMWISGALATFGALLAISVSVRRLHDHHFSGWWLLIAFTLIGIPLLLIGFALPGDPGPNRYGAQPGTRANTADNSGAA